MEYSEGKELRSVPKLLYENTYPTESSLLYFESIIHAVGYNENTVRPTSNLGFMDIPRRVNRYDSKDGLNWRLIGEQVLN